MIRSFAPTRIDLAGGTVDIWPLCHLLDAPGKTVNVALDRAAEATVEDRDDGHVTIRSEDLGKQVRYAVGRPPADALPLATGLIQSLLPRRSIAVTLRSAVPPQSGLGGSSALAVALGSSLFRAADRTIDAPAFLRFLQNFETRLLGLPTGYQDYYPGVYGGVQALTATYDGIQRVAYRQSIDFLEEHLVLVDSRLDHESGMNNWEIVRAFLDGDPHVRSSLNRINECAYAMEAAVAAADLDAAAEALEYEWQARRTLAPVVSNDRIEALIAAGKAAGAQAGKVCGAGGGGCIVFLAEPSRREAVGAAIEQAGGARLDVFIDDDGLRLEESADRDESGLEDG